MRTQTKHLTEAKIQRAIDAMRDVMETVEYDGSATEEIDRACDAVRALRRRAVR